MVNQMLGGSGVHTRTRKKRAATPTSHCTAQSVAAGTVSGTPTHASTLLAVVTSKQLAAAVTYEVHMMAKSV